MGFLLTSQDGWAFCSWVADIQTSCFRVAGINQAQLGCIFTDLRAYEPLLKLTVIDRWRGHFSYKGNHVKTKANQEEKWPKFSHLYLGICKYSLNVLLDQLLF